MLDDVFELGAQYEVLQDFEALLDQFKKGEKLFFCRQVYDHHDDIHGFFFTGDEGEVIRRWDFSSDKKDEIHQWKNYFRLVEKAPSVPELIKNPSKYSKAVAKILATESARKSAANLSLIMSAGLISPADRQQLFMDSCWDGNLQTFSLLLKSGADLNFQTQNGLTSLMIAVLNRHISVVAMLVGQKANLDLRDKDGQTALDMAQQRGMTEIVALLMNRIQK